MLNPLEVDVMVQNADSPFKMKVPTTSTAGKIACR